MDGRIAPPWPIAAEYGGEGQYSGKARNAEAEEREEGHQAREGKGAAEQQYVVVDDQSNDKDRQRADTSHEWIQHTHTPSF